MFITIACVINGMCLQPKCPAHMPVSICVYRYKHWNCYAYISASKLFISLHFPPWHIRWGGEVHKVYLASMYSSRLVAADRSSRTPAFGLCRCVCLPCRYSGKEEFLLDTVDTKFLLGIKECEDIHVCATYICARIKAILCISFIRKHRYSIKISFYIMWFHRNV